MSCLNHQILCVDRTSRRPVSRILVQQESRCKVDLRPPSWVESRKRSKISEGPKGPRTGEEVEVPVVVLQIVTEKDGDGERVGGREWTRRYECRERN